ncbi:glycosyltransferase family 2 protein [Verrucomicrobiota bacterium]
MAGKQLRLNLSVAVPALNEEAALKSAVEDLLHELRPEVESLDIIVVDDGSTDRTGEIADALAAQHTEVRVLHHEANRGIGAAYRAALAAAKGDYFVDFRGDHENAAAEIAQTVRHARPGAMVTTHHLSSDPRPWFRKLISRTYTGLLCVLFRRKVGYFNGLTLYPTGVLREFPPVSDGFLYSAETLIRALRRGLELVELEYPLRRRETGSSSALRMSSIRQALRDIRRMVTHE